MDSTIPDYPRDITFEQVWAAIHANRAAGEARWEEFERGMQELRESQKETDRMMKDYTKEMKESATRLDKQLGNLGNRFGEMVEYMVLPNLLDKFRELNFVFTKAYPHAVIRDRNNKVIAEADITLENGDKVMLVEVKSKLSTVDITEHIERIKKFRDHADKRNDKRKYMGAVAGMVMNENEKQFAFKNGFYVVEPSGETFIILKPESPYSVLEW